MKNSGVVFLADKLQMVLVSKVILGFEPRGTHDPQFFVLRLIVCRRCDTRNMYRSAQDRWDSFDVGWHYHCANSVIIKSGSDINMHSHDVHDTPFCSR